MNREAIFLENKKDMEAAEKMGIAPAVTHNVIKGTVAGVKNTGSMTVMMYDILKSW